MTLFIGNQRIRKVYRGADEIKRIYRGTDLVFNMLAGISNLKFFGLTADSAQFASTAFEDVGTIDITPSRDDVVLGMLVTVARISRTPPLM